MSYIARRRVPRSGTGRYTYAHGCAAPTLYSSCYAALARHLLGDLDDLPHAERADWCAYLNAHQDDDGLFRDPVIFGQGWYAGDPLWCGRPHLTCHVVAALACLGGAAMKPLRWLDPWRDPDATGALAGGARLGRAGGLDRQRDHERRHAAAVCPRFPGRRRGRAARSAVLLEWLAAHHLNPATGVWGHC